MSPVVILLVLFAVTLIMGVPFVWSLTFSCLVTMCLVGNFPMMTLMQKMYNGCTLHAFGDILFYACRSYYATWRNIFKIS